MSKSTKELLLATINTRLSCLEKLLEENQHESNIKFEEMYFSREYLHKLFKQIGNKSRRYLTFSIFLFLAIYIGMVIM